MISIILLANLYLVIFYVFYRLTLRNTTFFQVNRFYLLSSVVLAFACASMALRQPFNVFFAPQSLADWVNSTQLATITIGLSENTGSNHLSFNPLLSVEKFISSLTWIYWTGVAIGFLLFVYRLFKTFRNLKASTTRQAFSFFNNIKIDQTLIGFDQIVEHEKIHVHQKHSFDVLFIELALVFNWFNPFFYFLRKDLKLQHEFIADDIASQSNKISYAELLLANTFDVQPHLLTNQFHNPSILKTRIMMLLKNKTSNKHLVKLVGVLPMLVFMLIASSTISSCNNSTTENQQNEEIENIIESPIDETLELTIQELDTNVRKDEIRPPVVRLDKIEIMAVPNNDHYKSINEFRAWVAKNFVIPKEAVNANINDLVEVEFVINQNGSISHVKITKDPGYGLGNALKKLIENSYSWSPAIMNGHPVPSLFNLPIKINTEDLRN